MQHKAGMVCDVVLSQQWNCVERKELVLLKVLLHD